MTPTPPSLAELAELVALQLGRRQVDAGANLIDDLGASSVELVSLLAAIEDRWGIGLDETVFATVESVAELHVAVSEAC